MQMHMSIFVTKGLWIEPWSHALQSSGSFPKRNSSIIYFFIYSYYWKWIHLPRTFI